MAADCCWTFDLDRALRRVQKALERRQAHQALAAAEWMQRARLLAESKERRRWERHAARHALRQARRNARHVEKIERASAFKGVALAIEAIALSMVAVAYPHLWWLVFVSLCFGMGAIKHLSYVWERRQLDQAEAEEARRLAARKVHSPAQQPAPEARFPAIDQRLARVDVVCQKLQEEIQNGPQLLREIASRPAQTVKALQETCHELARRERELRAVATPDEEKRVLTERVELAERIARESDQIVRQRLGAALGALDDQLRQRQELATAAVRLEAESTRVLYTLENLATQILRVKSADTASRDVAGAGLRQSLELLTREVDAVAEALESVHEEPAMFSPIVPIAADPAEGRDGLKVRG